MKEDPNDGKAMHGGPENQRIRKLRHDIKNQLSNVFLAIEQLRYEIPAPTEDCLFYLDLISVSSANINRLLKETE